MIKTNANFPCDLEMDDESFETLSNLLERETGILLSRSKKNLVVSRLSKRLRLLGIAHFRDYCRLLDSERSGQEFFEFLSLLTTNVTKFFRECHHFDYLSSTVLPDLVERARRGSDIRLWSAGCSSGQEPYSLAMLLMGEFPDLSKHDIKILGTDIDREMVAKAEAATYDRFELQSVPERINIKDAFHDAGSDEQVLVSNSVRRLVTIKQLNLFGEWPMKRRFSVIFCRNVAIYFSQSTQDVLWKRFSDALEDGGYLFIGHSERILQATELGLKPVGVTVYQKSRSAN